MKPSDLVSKTGKTITLVPDEAGNFALPEEGQEPGQVSITLAYRVSRMNIDAQEQLRDKMKRGDQEWIAEAIVDRVLSWDIEDDKGKPFPLDVKRLRSGEIPADILVDIHTAIFEDSPLGKALRLARESAPLNGETLSGGSDLTTANGATSGAAQNGTRSSRRPSSSAAS